MVLAAEEEPGRVHRGVAEVCLRGDPPGDARGRATVQGRKSATSLYDFNLATYDEGDAFDQSSAPGFIDIYGLSSKVASQREERLHGKPDLSGAGVEK